MNTNAYFKQWTGCVSHLDPSYVKYDQADQYLYSVQAVFGGTRTLPAGDFNILAGADRLAPWYNSHRDGLGLAATTQTGVHIDYAWADNTNTLVGSPNIVGSGYSDHHYCYATVAF